MLNRTVILPVLYCKSSSNHVLRLLQNYIQQTTIHGREFPFSSIKSYYHLNISYQELQSKYYFPPIYSTEIMSEGQYIRASRIVNTTIKENSIHEYKRYQRIFSEISRNGKKESRENELYYISHKIIVLEHVNS